MFDLHRLIYPRCHDGLLGLPELNICTERASSGNPGKTAFLKIRYSISAYKIDVTLPFDQKSEVN